MREKKDSLSFGHVKKGCQVGRYSFQSGIQGAICARNLCRRYQHICVI